MALINSQLLKVSQDAVEQEIEKRVKVFTVLNPKVELIHLDSGDVTLPLMPSVIDAMLASVHEMGKNSTFKGRGPVRGYPFLIDAIVKGDFRSRGIKMLPEEVFVNEGTKQDVANIGDILCKDNRIGVLDPIFQTYIESNVVGYRAGILEKDKHWSNIVYLTATHEKGFIPDFPIERPDVIFLSYPNDPTGVALTKAELTQWVSYAIENKVLMLFDATYEAFISDPDVPHSIYEIKNARKVAIEFRSFSKSAGFTGLHCGYTVIPKEVKGYSIYSGRNIFLNDLWQRRQTIKNNAPSYIIQRAAEALYSEQGKREVKQNVDYYMTNAAMLRAALDAAGLKYSGGVNAPYIWVHSPWGSSWKLFESLFSHCRILSSPGERFGPSGEGYVRLSAFANQNQVMLACSRLADFKL
ncbi:MAG: LL-diaminopimelate aminotransferase [Prevotellaceae bacterium]|jgi:LL-diaminopimelate aminotransferase|nr:LL-diaminopimelate aminotransferase [Prevotellaceae bacterium]